MTNEILLTQEGYNKLRSELDYLKTDRKRQIADAIREAKAHGDLRENAAYHEAKLNQTRLESRIADLEKVLEFSKIVERPENSGERANLGSFVKLFDKKFSSDFTIELVGSFEVDPLNDKVSITSPLGSALLGKAKDEEFEVKTPSGLQSYQILEIH